MSNKGREILYECQRGHEHLAQWFVRDGHGRAFLTCSKHLPLYLSDDASNQVMSSVTIDTSPTARSARVAS